MKTTLKEFIEILKKHEANASDALVFIVTEDGKLPLGSVSSYASTKVLLLEPYIEEDKE